jgi:N-acylneuraminate cytidylyltransferase
MAVSLNHLKLGKLSAEGLFLPESYHPGQRTQDLDKRYFENGLFYLTSPNLIKQKELFGKNVQTVITSSQYSVDIDYKHDLLFAESLIQSNIKEYTYFI